MSMLDRPISNKIFESACERTPGGVHSAARAFKGMGITPLIAKEGRGDLLIDADGNAFIDYVQSWGALALGHAHPKVVEAVCNQVALGTSYGVSTELETQLVDKICSFLPAIEKLRFVSSGTEATMTAIRLALSLKPGKLVVFEGNYHGHATLPDHLVLPYNDLDAVERAFANHEIGAVIVEPVAGNMGVVPATQEFLDTLRRQNSILIFDEVMCGFRVGRGSAQSLYGIEPDLTCLGKIIGGGFPCAAFGGKAEIMDNLTPQGKVFHAGTLSGNPVAMAAGLATLEELEKPGIYEELERKTRILTDGIDSVRRGSMFSMFNHDAEIFKRYFLHMLERGIYMPQSHMEAAFVSLAHTDEHLHHTRKAIEEFAWSMQCV